MKKLILSLLSLTLATAVFAQGHLVISGGGGRPTPIMETFVELAGGGEARVVVVPYASGYQDDTADYQVNQIREKGAGTVRDVRGDSSVVEADSILARFAGASGVWLSGGDQRRLARWVLGTTMMDSIRAVYERGGVVGGTSAGAAVMSEIMITGDEAVSTDERPFAVIQKGNVITSRGFGFVTRAIIDQHFVRRSRHNRLVNLVLEHPDLVGVGIDERTALVVAPDRTFQVIGEGTVLIYDASGARVSARPSDGRLRAHGMTMHVLLAGDRYDLKAQELMD